MLTEDIIELGIFLHPPLGGAKDPPSWEKTPPNSVSFCLFFNVYLRFSHDYNAQTFAYTPPIHPQYTFNTPPIHPQYTPNFKFL